MVEEKEEVKSELSEIEVLNKKIEALSSEVSSLKTKLENTEKDNIVINSEYTKEFKKGKATIRISDKWKKIAEDLYTIDELGFVNFNVLSEECGDKNLETYATPLIEDISNVYEDVVSYKTQYAGRDSYVISYKVPAEDKYNMDIRQVCMVENKTAYVFTIGQVNGMTDETVKILDDVVSTVTFE